MYLRPNPTDYGRSTIAPSNSPFSDRDRAAAQVIRLRGLELAQYPGTLGIGAIFKKIRFCCQDET